MICYYNLNHILYFDNDVKIYRRVLVLIPIKYTYGNFPDTIIIILPKISKCYGCYYLSKTKNMDTKLFTTIKHNMLKSNYFYLK